MSDDELLDLIRTRDASDDSDEPELSEDKLRPMRAIWLELPDEDAPPRGLDALMAAATLKAKEMAPAAPSFWQRFLALLKQPPVLALATVVVLVGGAALVNRRGDELEVVQKVSVQSGSSSADRYVQSGSSSADKYDGERGYVAPTTPPAEAADELTRGATATTAVVENATTPGSVAAEREKQKPAVKPPPKLPVPASRPPPSLALESKATGRVGGDVAKDSKSEAQKSEAPVESTPPPVTMNPTVVAQEPADDSRAEGLREQPTAQPKPATTQAQPASVDQLLKQCKSAATRGDCPAARVIADRIARANATFYRERVTKDAAIAKCLD